MTAPEESAPGSAVRKELRNAFHAPRQAPPEADHVVLTCANAITSKPVHWLWKDWIARGKMQLLAGAPGQGKTTIAMSFAATVSAGGFWPDRTRCEPGRVLIYSGEDDPADTLKPRLEAAGADCSRCHFVAGSVIDGERHAFDLAHDLPRLIEAIEQLGGVDLLILDPIVGAVTGDSHRNAETRRDLQPLVDLAAACDCALLGITHFSKGSQGADPVSRVIGSVAFSALARGVLVAAKVKSEDGKPKRLLARAKISNGPEGGAFEYGMEQVELQSGILAVRTGWGAWIDGEARELLTDPNTPEEGDAGDVAKMLAQELATDCSTPVTDVLHRMAALGFSKKQVWRASKKLRVIRKKGGMAGGWYWRLPGGTDPELAEDALEDAEGAHSQERASSAPSGTFEESQRPDDSIESAESEDSEVFE